MQIKRFRRFATILLCMNLIGCLHQRQSRVMIKTMSVETELYLIDTVKLEYRLVPAIADFLGREDAAAVDKLVQETLSEEPFLSLAKTDKVLADYFAQGSLDLLSGNLPGEMFDDSTGQTTTNPEVIRRRKTENVLTRFLVLYWCARYPHGAPVGITLNRGVLADYIRRRSEWIDEMLALSNEFLWEAPDLRPSIGGQAKLLTQVQAGTLLSALLKVPAPTESGLRLQYEGLKRLLETAVNDPRYRILIHTG